MELSLESAFSTGGMVGHLSYLLLVISMFMRAMGPLRVFVILSAVVAIAYDVFWLKDPIGVFWETALVVVNLFQLTFDWIANRRVVFSDEEKALVSSRFKSLSARDARKLLNAGLWLSAPANRVLTTEGETATHLVYISQGHAEISYKGKAFSWCGPGNFIGEMSILDQGPAGADAKLTEPSHLWLISGRAVRRLWRDHPNIAQGLELGFSTDWKEKLGNQRTFNVTAPA